MTMKIHKSDCSIYNEPAYPKGDCDCKTEPTDFNYREAYYFICGYLGGAIRYNVPFDGKKMMQEVYREFDVLPVKSLCEVFEIETEKTEKI